MNDTLLRTDPSQLTVRDEVSPGLTPVGDQVLELLTLDTGSKEGNSLADDLVAATDCESLTEVNTCVWGNWGRLVRDLPYRDRRSRNRCEGYSRRLSSRQQRSWHRSQSCQETSTLIGSIGVLEWRSWVEMFTHRESDVPRRGLCDGNHDV